jgi:hypothetical protein
MSYDFFWCCRRYKRHNRVPLQHLGFILSSNTKSIIEAFKTLNTSKEIKKKRPYCDLFCRPRRGSTDTRAGLGGDDANEKNKRPKPRDAASRAPAAAAAVLVVEMALALAGDGYETRLEVAAAAAATAITAPCGHIIVAGVATLRGCRVLWWWW